MRREQRVVMFGGRGDGTGESPTWPTDVWEWDGTRWYRITNTGMPRILHPMAGYDPVRRHVVVTGGAFLTDDRRFCEIFANVVGMGWRTLDGAGYRGSGELFPRRTRHDTQGRVIILGGPPGVNRDSARVSSRTWVFSGSAWTAREGSPGVQQPPGGRRRTERNALHVPVVGKLADVAVDACARHHGCLATD